MTDKSMEAAARALRNRYIRMVPGQTDATELAQAAVAAYLQTGDPERVERVAKAIYEADLESGYVADDPLTHWRGEAYPEVVWDLWAKVARAAIRAMADE